MIDYLSHTQLWVHLTISAIILLAAVILWHICKKACAKHLNAMNKEKHTIFRVLTDILKYVGIIGIILLILQINGVNVSSAIAGLGIASAIVGLALQDVLKDVIMGINILTENFFSVGDVVEYQDVEGVVTKLTLRTTKIQSIIDQSVTTVCNRNISQIRKCSSQVDIDIPLSYDEDIRKVHMVMQQISEKIVTIDGIDRCLYKGTENFDEYAVIYKMRFFCPPEKKPDLRRGALKIIQDELLRADIRIPYRKMDLFLWENTK